MVAKELKQLDCYPVFLGRHLKERYYKGAVSDVHDGSGLRCQLPSAGASCSDQPAVCLHAHSLAHMVLHTVVTAVPAIRSASDSHAGFCKQQLWPLFHYLLPLSPTSTCRFDPDLWQAYVKANKVRSRDRRACQS